MSTKIQMEIPCKIHNHNEYPTHNMDKSERQKKKKYITVMLTAMTTLTKSNRYMRRNAMEHSYALSVITKKIMIVSRKLN